MLENSHSVVICTRSRSDSLLSLINSINSCSCSQEAKVIVVLNGHSQHELSSLRQLVDQLRLGVEILESPPGLAAARNVALKYVSSDIISFLDDDVLLSPDYFIEIDRVFTEFPQIQGLSPRIEGLYQSQAEAKPSFLKRQLKYGKVTRSGQNFWVPDVYSRKITFVDWLPGCSMSYRVSALQGKHFSEELMLGPAGGYSLGEDVDFSLQFNKLISLNTICVSHLQASSVRDQAPLMADARGRFTAFLAKKYPNKVSFSYALIFNILALAYFGIRVVFDEINYKNLFRQRVVFLKGFLREWRRPKLVKRELDE